MNRSPAHGCGKEGTWCGLHRTSVAWHSDRSLRRSTSESLNRVTVYPFRTNAIQVFIPSYCSKCKETPGEKNLNSSRLTHSLVASFTLPSSLQFSKWSIEYPRVSVWQALSSKRCTGTHQLQRSVAVANRSADLWRASGVLRSHLKLGRRRSLRAARQTSLRSLSKTA